MAEKTIKKGIYRLRKKRMLLETYLLNTGKQMPVWMSLQYTYCKKGNCKCTRGQPHGPFYYLSFQDKGKVIHRYVPEKKVSEIKRLSLSYKTYNERLAQLNKINKQVDRILRKEQKKNLVAIPSWIKKKKSRKKD